MDDKKLTRKEKLKLFESLLPTIHRIASKLTYHGHPEAAPVDYEDFVSIGKTVVWHDVLPRYRASKGASLKTYTACRVRGAILDELRKLDPVPRSSRTKKKLIEAAHEFLSKKYEREPTRTEIVEHLGIQDPEKFFGSIVSSSTVRLDEPIFDASTDTFQEIVPDIAYCHPMEELDRQIAARHLGLVIQELPDMDRKVVALYYFEGMRMWEIAEAFNLTESRICQILNQKVYPYLRQRLAHLKKN